MGRGHRYAVVAGALWLASCAGAPKEEETAPIVSRSELQVGPQAPPKTDADRARLVAERHYRALETEDWLGFEASVTKENRTLAQQSRAAAWYDRGRMMVLKHGSRYDYARVEGQAGRYRVHFQRTDGDKRVTAVSCSVRLDGSAWLVESAEQ